MFSNKMLKKKTFFLAIYQLKNTSDCIKIDPPGPGRNLKKIKKVEKMAKDFWYFLFFAVKTYVFVKKSGRAPSGRAGPGPPSRV